MSERDYESKAQFLEALRDEGAVLDGIEYFTEGEGSATSYKARNEDGEVESVTKSEIEAVWDAVNDDDETDDQDGDEEHRGNGHRYHLPLGLLPVKHDPKTPHVLLL